MLARLSRLITPEHKTGYDGSVADQYQAVYALIHSSRAFAFVMAGETNRSWRLQWVTRGEAVLLDSRADDSTRRVVGRVWLAKSYRARGIARRLVTSVALNEGSTPTEMTFQAPFTPAGSRLVQSLVPDNWFGDGDFLDFEDILVEPS